MIEPVKIVLLRHGKTEYNIKKIFTGWTDIGLAEEGVKEAEAAGKLLAKKKYSFDVIYSSALERAARTAEIVRKEMGIVEVPIIKSWRLNERHYGALQGASHAEMEKKFGEEQVFRWRRSYSEKPPMLEKSDARNPAKDPKYAGLRASEIPLGESLEDTVKRVVPFWKKEIEKELKKGKKILISASGNSIRALVKYLDKIPDSEIPKLEIPTGKPLVYELGENLRPIRHYYLE